MSGWADRVVRLAARTLPVTIRDRYREEWRADVAGASDAGVRASGVVMGAVLFSATLDRTAPEISGVPLSAAARYHARWGLALFATAAVLLVGAWLDGMTVGLAALACCAAVISLWRAAAHASVLAVISAALATLGVASIGVGVLIPFSMTPMLLVATLCLLAAGVVGLIVWSSAPTAPAAQARIEPERRPATVWLLTIAMLASVAIGALDLLVWSPMWMAPGLPLATIYSSLSDLDRASGLGFAWAWVAIWSAVTIGYLILGLVTRFGRTTAVLAGLGIIAAMVFFQFWAGFSLGMSISDTLPPYRGGRSEFGSLYGMLGRAALIVVILMVIAPMRQAAATTPSTASP